MRIRIQGTNTCDLWREREIFDIIRILNARPNDDLNERSKEIALDIRRYIEKKMKESPEWDKFLLDVAYTLVLNYLDSIRSDDDPHTRGDMAEYIKNVASRDDGGVYKIYDQYKEQDQCILKENYLTIVLTTMHKVKGLEFDVVVLTPSTASLPLKPHHNYKLGESLMKDDLADIDEEKRLMFVAYTRAKKYLHVYKGEREKSIESSNGIMQTKNASNQIMEYEPGLSKYNLSYTLSDTMFEKDEYITNHVRKDDEVIIDCDQYGRCYIRHDELYIGMLSKDSELSKTAYRLKRRFELPGFYVSDICAWTYQDTEATGNPDFINNWGPKSKKQGYIYVVQIAGIGIIE